MIEAMIIKILKLKRKARSYFDAVIYVPLVLPVMRRMNAFTARRQMNKARASYSRSALKSSPDTFALYRILGNDLPPRHKQGQTRENLKFMLEHEPEFPGCAKIWVLNRIVDRDEKDKIISLLKKKNSEYIDIPFDADEYRRIGVNEQGLPPAGYLERRPGDEWLRLTVESQKLKNKNLYLMNNNGARNLALRHGRDRAKWIMPWDGNCFLTMDAWKEIQRSVAGSPWVRYFMVPMARTGSNENLLGPGFRPRAEEEPQIIFRSDALEEFDEDLPYGSMPKVELLRRLRVPGKWDAWPRVHPWEKKQGRGRSPERFQFSWCGWVARLDSGNEQAERDPGSRGLERVRGIVGFINSLDASLR